jgi:large subunit ribosomal protein L21
MSAIIEVGTGQHKVAEGATIRVHLLKAAPGDKVELDKVLAVLGEGPAVFGRPYVDGAKVEATVVRHGKDKKIRVFKFKAKKRIRKTIGHRQDYTELKIEKITAG